MSGSSSETVDDVVHRLVQLPGLQYLGQFLNEEMTAAAKPTD